MKSRDWLILLFVLLSVFFVSLSLDLIEVYEKAGFVAIWFVLSISVLSTYLIIRGLKYKIDSNLFIGILLFGIAIITIVSTFTHTGFFYFWPYLFLTFAVSHFSVLVYFADKQHSKFVVGNLVVFLISMLYVYQVIDLIFFLLLLCIWLFSWAIIYFALLNRR